MNIISEKEENGRMIDGIHTILKLPEAKFSFLIKSLQPKEKALENIRFYYLTDGYEIIDNPIQLGLEQTHDENGKYIGRSYFGGQNYSMHQIIEKCQSLLGKYLPNSIEYSRIIQLINTRNLDGFKSLYLNKDNSNSTLIDKIFEILSDDNMLSKFLDYDNNTQTFAINGKEIPISEYLKYLGQFFGNKDENGNLSNTNPISKDFYIPNLEELKSRYSQIFDEINIDKYVNPAYTFLRAPNILDTIIRDGEEPDWTISPEIYKEIFEDMPQNLSLEEQAMYIYCKMCTIFSYDEGYLYRDKLNKINYESTFSKEHLESLVPGSKITCYDFSRIYTKLINELDGDITAVLILEGANEGHALSGFYTHNVSATVEAINVSDTQKDSTNDLMKAKNGIKLRGINTISDRNGIIQKAINTVYPQVLGKQPVSIKQYIQELKSIPQDQNIPNDVVLKLQSLLEVMKVNNVFGNEFTQTLWGVGKTNYFGNVKLEKAYLGELQKKQNGQEKYKRHILLRPHENEKNVNLPNDVYMIDTDSLELIVCSSKEIIDKLNSGKLIYESGKHKLPGIDKEVTK